MTTKRTYREVVSQEEALQELRRCSGTQLDLEFVEVFCRAINEAAKQDQDPCCVNRNCYRMGVVASQLSVTEISSSFDFGVPLGRGVGRSASVHNFSKWPLICFKSMTGFNP